MSEPIILVALSTFAQFDREPLHRLEQSGRPFRVHNTGSRITTPELLQSGRDAAVIIAGVEPYDAETLAALPALKCIVRCGVGTDNVDLDAARARNIAVLNTPDVPTAAVAELTISMFLALARNLRPQANLLTARRWERVESHLLGGRTVGLIGLGRIGRKVADLCRAFGAFVIACDPCADPALAKAADIRIDSLDNVLRTADFLSIHAARSAGSPLFIGADEIRRMKRGAVFVNVARGGMVDEAALLHALQTGHLAGAGLDVFEQEPYDGPLCDLEQVILTPHSATLPVETRIQMELECLDKALRFLEGGILPAERVT